MVRHDFSTRPSDDFRNRQCFRLEEGSELLRTVFEVTQATDMEDNSHH